MTGAKMRPSGVFPVVSAVTILLCGPVAESGLLIGRQVWSHENPQPRNCETDIRSTLESGHVRLAKEAARRVAIRAASEGDEIFSPRDC